jgi:integration host factor subunit beta
LRELHSLQDRKDRLVSFTVKLYDSYSGRNPRTGVETKINAKKFPFFKVGKDLREAVNAGRE